MKTAEEIFNDARFSEDIPDYENILEINCFMSLRILLKQFYNNHITKEQASRLKLKIFRRYEKDKKQLEFKKNLYDEHIKRNAETSELRRLLRHQLKEQDEYSFETALKLISLYSNERWDICGDKTS